MKAKRSRRINDRAEKGARSCHVEMEPARRAQDPERAVGRGHAAVDKAATPAADRAEVPGAGEANELAEAVSGRTPVVASRATGRY